MDARAYVTRGLLRLPLSGMDARDVGLVASDLAQRHGEGWSLDDAVAFLRCAEHVSPGLPEDVALRRMNAIAAKYRKGQGY